MRVFRRCFASARIPVSFSHGFNPHPRLSFGPSLRTGWESLDEYMDVPLDMPVTDLAARCNAHLPQGLRILEAAVLCGSVPKLSVDVTAARYEISLDGADVFGEESEVDEQLPNRMFGRPARRETDRGTDVLGALESAIRERFAAGPKEDSSDGEAVPGAPVLLKVGTGVSQNEPSGSLKDTRITIDYLSTMYGGKSLFPEDILHPFLGDPTGYATPIRVVRTSLYVRRTGDYLSPISRAVVEKRI